MSEANSDRRHETKSCFARSLAALLCVSLIGIVPAEAQVSKPKSTTTLKRVTQPTATRQPIAKPLPPKEVGAWTITERISARWDPASGDGAAKEIAISSNGRFVAFASEADNLVVGDSPGNADVFVLDRSTGVIELISKGHDGSPADRASRRPDISADGRYVVFYSTATNLVPGDIGGSDTFLYDRNTGVMRWVSFEEDPLNPGVRIDANNPSGSPAISDDGHTIVFERTLNNLPGNPTHIFVYRYNPGDGSETIEPVDLVPGTANLANRSAFRPAISGDGRFVAYQSRATDLFAQDSNDHDDIFLHDFATSRLIRASRGWTGSDDCSDPAGANADFASYGAALSADGRYLAFRSNASNLTANDTNGNTADIFVFDRTTCITELVSRASRNADGSPGEQGDSWAFDRPAISADGQYVAFNSFATNMVEGDSNGTYDIFVTDWFAGETLRVSVPNTASVGEANAESKTPALSGDGRLIVFLSEATNLVSGDSNGLTDGFLRDLDAGSTERVGNACTMTVANDSSYAGALSADGRLASFNSRASNLVPGASTFGAVFLRDRKSGTVELVSVANDGTPADGPSSGGSMSDDGRFVVFQSRATNLASIELLNQAGFAQYPDIYLRDRRTQTTIRVSEDPNGNGSEWYTRAPVISADGNVIAFQSGASNLVPTTTREWRVILYDRTTGRLVPVSETIDGEDPNGPSLDPSLSADGRFVAFMSRATNLDAGDRENDWDVYVYDRSSGTVEWISRDLPGTTGTEAANPAISADGRYVAYGSVSYIDGQPSDVNGVAVFDRTTGQVFPGLIGQPPLWPGGNYPAISRDGDLIAVHAINDDFVPDTFYSLGTQVFHRTEMTWSNIAESAHGTNFSASGQLVVFMSMHEGLVADGVETDYRDVFIAARDASLDPYLGAKCGR